MTPLSTGSTLSLQGMAGSDRAALAAAASGAGQTSNLGDARGLDALRARAAQDPKSAAREAAKQFETLFMQQLLKTMREATRSEEGLDNEGSKLGSEMLDTQWSTKLAGRPGGLSDVIARQLERQMGLAGSPVPTSASANQSLSSDAARALTRPQAPVALPQQAAAGFISQHGNAAQEAEARSGIPASFMLAQAAHETGWGQKEIRHPDGSSTHNLFGIKAGPGWKGATADVVTTEYSNGQPRRVVQTFRAYGSYAESFQDYAHMMATSPRYAQVASAGHSPQDFAQGLQKAGYATDPAYADKLSRVINTTLRLQRSVQS